MMGAWWIYGGYALVASLFAWAAIRLPSFRSKEPGPWCAQCGYSLCGVDTRTQCPECGVSLLEKTPHFYPATDDVWRWVAIVMWTLALAVLVFSFERTVMVKTQANDARWSLLQPLDSTKPEYAMVGYRRATLWLVGPHKYEALVKWSAGESYYLQVRHEGNGQWPEYEANLLDGASAMIYTKPDGTMIRRDDGLTVAALLAWWEDTGLAVSHQEMKVDAAEMVEWLRCLILDEAEPPESTQVYLGGGHGSRGDAVTPLWLLVPLLAVSLYIWWRGARRIWRGS